MSRVKKEKKEKYSPGFERFINATDEYSDLIIMVLRVHLLVEYYLDQILMMKIPRGDLLTNEKFSQKVKLVESLDVLKDEDIAAIRALNKVRNDCSHGLNYEIGEQDIDKIGNCYGIGYLKDKKEFNKDKKNLLKFTLMTIAAHLDNFMEKAIK